MRRLLLGLLPALALTVAFLAVALLAQRGMFPNPPLTLQARFDLAGLLSRVGPLLGLAVAAAGLLALGLARLIHEARQGERARSEAANARFLRRLDHELKNPLTILRLGAVNLQQGSNLTPEQASSLDRVAHQVMRLQTLVQDLRWLSDLEAKELERVAVPLQEVLQEVASLATTASGQASHAIDVSLQQAPWPLGTVYGDRELLVMAFRNLVDNALKFSPAGSRVEVRATDDGSTAVIEVADTGPGIPEVELPHVFEELYRGRNAQGVEGSGLGLSLVQRIIRLHGGQVAVRSQLQQGTLVTVRLPVAPARRRPAK